MKRPTIADVAERAGVSKGAVSYALNGLPGVSEATRRRVVAVARELGWQPNSAARALSGAPSRIIGMALRRPAETLGTEPFFMRLIGGVEMALSAKSYALTLQVVADQAAEIAVYDRWWNERRVDGVLLCDLQVRDPRIEVLEALSLPTVVVGAQAGAGSHVSVWSDDAAAMADAVEYLAALGHRRIARVSGLPELLHTQVRSEAFVRTCEQLGVAFPPIVPTDYSGDSGARATRRLLSARERPSAIIFDNDVMAAAALAIADEMGFSVPGDLSVVAWDDSPLCRLLRPQLTALSRDITMYGARAAELLLDVIAGRPASSVQTETAHLAARGSTAAPR